MDKEIIKTEWAIVICTFNRKERFLTCLNSLIASTVKYGEGVQIIIMDNSPKRGLEKSLNGYIHNNRNISITYNYNRQANQSELRNLSIKYLKSSVRFIFFLDSDIYISKATIPILTQYLNNNYQVKAIAPPLVSYKNGKHELQRKRTRDSIKMGGIGLIMPSNFDYQMNDMKGDLLVSQMLRGAFILRKEILITHFGEKPWHSAFKVWQNVPFFLTLKELEILFGYLINYEIIALHDNRPHNDTIKFQMHLWEFEVYKSIILLIFRNKLWLNENYYKNTRFINNMKDVLSKLHQENPDKLIKQGLEIAVILDNEEEHAKMQLMEFKAKNKDKTIQNVINLLLKTNWNDIKSIKSLNYSKVI